MDISFEKGLARLQSWFAVKAKLQLIMKNPQDQYRANVNITDLSEESMTTDWAGGLTPLLTALWLAVLGISNLGLFPPKLTQ